MWMWCDVLIDGSVTVAAVAVAAAAVADAAVAMLARARPHSPTADCVSVCCVLISVYRVCYLLLLLLACLTYLV